MSDIKIVSEPLTYRRDGDRSYFRDIALREAGNAAADERLQRHAVEMRAELPQREAEREQRARDAGIEFRINPNRTDGQGGNFSPPLWLIDEFAPAPRTSRTLSALIPSLPLPRGVSEVKLPRLTVGTRTYPVADGQAVSDRDITDAAASQPVTAIAGMSDIALQLLEQSPGGAHIDFALFKDLTASYDGQLEAALINGTANGMTGFTGILNLATGAGGVNAVTYTDSSPTPLEMLPFLGQAAAQVGNTRFMPPEAWLMRTSRKAWLATVDPGNQILQALQSLGWPIVADDAIPATYGGTGPTNGTQDAVIAMRPSDGLLLESAQHTEIFLEPLSGVLMARLRLHGSVCAIHRLPTGIATVTGTGMAVQSGF